MSANAPFSWKGTTVLVTGGTGTFGQAFARYLLRRDDIAVLRILSRDELKQWEFRRRVADDRLRFLIGDVRDRERLLRAFDGVDVVIHAAAMKQVPAAEYNPFEAVKTNILGAQNVIDAAIERGVKKVVALSTDKAANPVNLYGATKLCAEKLIVQGNAYVGPHRTRFACVRYGNVVASRGSVVPLFMEQRDRGVVTLTDRRMTRFWITVGQAVEFVGNSVEAMRGGEVFVPKLPSVRIAELIAAVAPGCRVEEVGIRPGEKLHETLVTADEARHTVDNKEQFIVLPEHLPDLTSAYASHPRSEGRPYASDTNERWLSGDALATALPIAMREAEAYRVEALSRI
jgi:UDP-N-acetylglucosamine 4,6-dehydratase